MVFRGKFVRIRPCDGLRLVALRGSGFRKGKDRIVDFFKENSKKSERVAFVKKEYGIGGFGSPDRKANYVHLFNTYGNKKGIVYSYCDELGNSHDYCEATWGELVDKIAELIEKGEYIKRGEDT